MYIKVKVKIHEFAGITTVFITMRLALLILQVIPDARLSVNHDAIAKIGARALGPSPPSTHGNNIEKASLSRG